MPNPMFRRLAVLLAAASAMACGREAATTGDQAGSHAHYAAVPDKPNADGQLAPRLQNLGAYTFPVTTKTEQAQQFINQGLNLAYGFNHAEAGRAFREAAGSIPIWRWPTGARRSCSDRTSTRRWTRGRAEGLRAGAESGRPEASATPREQAYIDALAAALLRQARGSAARDRAYADAMREVAKRFPDDLDARRSTRSR